MSRDHDEEIAAADREAFRDDGEIDPPSLFKLISDAVASRETGSEGFLHGALMTLGDDLEALHEAITDDAGHLHDGGKLSLEKIPDMLYRLSLRAHAAVQIAARYRAVRRLEAKERAQ